MNLKRTWRGLHSWSQFTSSKNTGSSMRWGHTTVALRWRAGTWLFTCLIELVTDRHKYLGSLQVIRFYSTWDFVPISQPIFSPKNKCVIQISKCFVMIQNVCLLAVSYNGLHSTSIPWVHPEEPPWRCRHGGDEGKLCRVRHTQATIQPAQSCIQKTWSILFPFVHVIRLPWRRFQITSLNPCGSEFSDER